MTRRRFLGAALGMGMLAFGLAGCNGASQDQPDGGAGSNGADDGAADASGAEVASDALGASPRAVDGCTFTAGSQFDRGFAVDNVLETQGRTLHFSLHVPESYDGSTPYALYVACPGWEGLWFQGVGANLQEDFPFVANDYIADMIVASPQLDDWGAQSAEDTIALTEWLAAAFNIDGERVYLSGCSGGGETISLVLGMRPELYRRALHVISRWDGDILPVVQQEVPVRMSIGEHDDYYGPEPVTATYEEFRSAYRARGLDDERIAQLLVLDVKPTSYFTERGLPAGAGQHGGGGALFPHDEDIMGWLFQ